MVENVVMELFFPHKIQFNKIKNIFYVNFVSSDNFFMEIIEILILTLDFNFSDRLYQCALERNKVGTACDRMHARCGHIPVGHLTAHRKCCVLSMVEKTSFLKPEYCFKVKW